MKKKYLPKDFSSDQEVKWCIGCGDYSILKQMKAILPETGLLKEKIVFISGIGCSSRFPYYMNTFGLHGIHGRAPSIATGIKLARPDLSIWIITGDGDGFSIGTNHIIHLLRRNLDVNILLINNEIYALTKGQYSPTSNLGLFTKSSPMGNIDPPFNSLSLVLSSGAGFIARTIDKNTKHLREILLRAHKYSGTSFLEIYQNCNIFNDGVFNLFTEKNTKFDNTLYLKHNNPLIFGSQNQWGIYLDDLYPRIVSLNDGNYSISDLWIHDEKDFIKATILVNFFGAPKQRKEFPCPFGVFYQKNRAVYDVIFHNQISEAKKNKPTSLDEVISGSNTWKI